MKQCREHLQDDTDSTCCKHTLNALLKHIHTARCFFAYLEPVGLVQAWLPQQQAQLSEVHAAVEERGQLVMPRHAAAGPNPKRADEHAGGECCVCQADEVKRLEQPVGAGVKDGNVIRYLLQRER